MTSNLHTGKSLEEAVVTLFKFMGYHTVYHNETNTLLQTRPVLINAEMHHPKEGQQKLLIECKHTEDESIGLKEVQMFCCRVAFARENSEANMGMLVSKSEFSEEAMSWCARNCSFVELKTYKQLIRTSVRFKKLLKKFHGFPKQGQVSAC
jgi:restriction endonuclease Mrr